MPRYHAFKFCLRVYTSRRDENSASAHGLVGVRSTGTEEACWLAYEPACSLPIFPSEARDEGQKERARKDKTVRSDVLLVQLFCFSIKLTKYLSTIHLVFLSICLGTFSFIFLLATASALDILLERSLPMASWRIPLQGLGLPDPCDRAMVWLLGVCNQRCGWMSWDLCREAACLRLIEPAATWSL